MRTYEKPVMNVEHFVPNEFIATCGVTNKVYKFVCDAGDGNYGGVWVETNNIDGLQTNGRNSDERISYSTSSFHACGIEHEASTRSEFLNGYYLEYGKKTSEAIPVIIWRGADGNNVHCTTNLDINTWETDKS